VLPFEERSHYFKKSSSNNALNCGTEKRYRDTVSHTLFPLVLGPMGECKYSCKSAEETLAWINDIIRFLAPYSSLINAHVVNFFKVLVNSIFHYFFLICNLTMYKEMVMIEFQDRLWENVDAEWIECLRREPVRNLLLIPSGAVQVGLSDILFSY